MSLVTLAEARLHLRHDSGTTEDTLIQLWLDAAEAQALAFLNRNVYADETALSTAQAGAAATLEAAVAAYDTAMDGYAALDDANERSAKEGAARATLEAAKQEYRATMDGIAVNETVRAAILLLVGHLYQTRSEDAPVPRAVQALLMPYRANMGI